jgi:hypothetical protein
MLNVGAVERELCYIAKEGAEQIRFKSNNANVIFREEQIVDI